MEEPGEDHDDGTVARVASIYIAKASGMVCLRIPHDTIEGRRLQRVWTVASTTNGSARRRPFHLAQGAAQRRTPLSSLERHCRHLRPARSPQRLHPHSAAGRALHSQETQARPATKALISTLLVSGPTTTELRALATRSGVIA